MRIQPVSFESHQAAKRLSRARDEAEIESGRVSRKVIAVQNGGLGRFVRPGSLGVARKRLKSFS